jgi:preprotein translocase subunit YajC
MIQNFIITVVFITMAYIVIRESIKEARKIKKLFKEGDDIDYNS